MSFIGLILVLVAPKRLLGSLPRRTRA